ncbi:MAG: GtrA family protein [Deltaproteobacteria bacterium]|nr:GtrA family protein [Deltaproteobacteria bacterium]
MMITDKIARFPLIGPLVRHRFMKFGVVGASGTLVNLIMLFMNQEIFLKSLTPPETRLKASLAIAIFLATMNNFLWNRWWTWRDRKGKTHHGFLVQMFQYYLACALAMSLQYIFTILLARIIYYLVANMIAIGLSAMLVYIINDLWTFALRREARKGDQEACLR